MDNNGCSGQHFFINQTIRAIGLTKTWIILLVFLLDVEADDVGEGNAGASRHGVQDNPNLVKARGRRVHINGHGLQFGYTIPV